MCQGIRHSAIGHCDAFAAIDVGADCHVIQRTSSHCLLHLGGCVARSGREHESGDVGCVWRRCRCAVERQEARGLREDAISRRQVRLQQRRAAVAGEQNVAGCNLSAIRIVKDLAGTVGAKRLHRIRKTCKWNNTLLAAAPVARCHGYRVLASIVSEGVAGRSDGQRRAPSIDV